MIDEEMVENFKTSHQERLNKLIDYRGFLINQIAQNLDVDDDLQLWAHLATFGSGCVRCNTLGVYIMTEEFLDKLCHSERKAKEK